MVLGEQRAEIAERAGDDVEHAAVDAVRHFLREPRDAHAVLHAHFAVVRLDFARNQLEQVDLPAPLRPTTQMRSLRSIESIAFSSSSGPPTE